MVAQPGNLLLVSHVASEREQIAQVLAEDSHLVRIAEDTDSALSIIRHEKPELVLIDTALAGESAFRLCRKLRDGGELAEIAVLVLLDGVSAGAEALALDCGADDVMQRPVDKLGLRLRIRSLLKHRKALANVRGALEHLVEKRTSQLQKEVAAHKCTAEMLLESQGRYALAAQGANDGLWDWDLLTNKIHFSPRLKNMLGHSASAAMDSPEQWFEHVNRQDIDQLWAELIAHLEGHTERLAAECRIQRKDGTTRWLLVRGMAIRDRAGTPYRIAGSQTDITPRKLMELQLRHDAFHDMLTNLPNRALFLDRLNCAIAKMKRNENYRYAVLLLDVDRFKLVNDSLGHAMGDRLLIEFARRLRECPRATDTVARLGGDEFVVLLDEVDGLAGAKVMIERIQRAFESPLDVQGRQIFVSSSIGLAFGKPRYQVAEDLLRDADIALYRAKALGPGKVQSFLSGMHEKVVSQLNSQNELREAVKDCRQFVLHYQPILSLRNGRLAGFEALIRWNHPVRGMVFPADFIPEAEQGELISPITYWILRTVCMRLKAWESDAQRKLPLFVNINMSVKSLSDPGFAYAVGQIISAAHVEPSQIKFELTESSLMKEPELALLTLSCLKATGVELMVDDFGTGYSCLSYLHRLPMNALKIDRSFVSSVPSEARNMEIVRTIALLAERLGLQTVAEGIETQEQCQWLKSIGCQLGQGYLFSRPLNAEDAYEFLGRDLASTVHHRGTSAAEPQPNPKLEIVNAKETERTNR